MSEAKHKSIFQAAADNFLRDLTDLSVKHGIAINGGELFVMEYDDMPHCYEADADSKLLRR